MLGAGSRTPPRHPRPRTRPGGGQHGPRAPDRQQRRPRQPLARAPGLGQRLRGRRTAGRRPGQPGWPRPRASARCSPSTCCSSSTATASPPPTSAPGRCRLPGRLRPPARRQARRSNSGGPPRGAATVSAVTATTDSTDENRAAQLRNQLADWISGRGTFQTPSVEQAFRTVSRHEFLPGHSLEDAYSRKPVVTQRAPDGSSTSSASSPNLVARCSNSSGRNLGTRCWRSAPRPGSTPRSWPSLPAPAGGSSPSSTTATSPSRPQRTSAAPGYPGVQVITGDGALGHSKDAPYDRIIITAEATDVTAAWWDQLAPNGRIVVPVRLHGSGLTRAIGLHRTGQDTMVSQSAHVCGFVPMRGSAEQAEQQIRLDAAAMLKVDAADLPDAAALARAFGGPADGALDRDPGARRRARRPPGPVAPHHARSGYGCQLQPAVRHPGRPRKRARRIRPCAGPEPASTTAAPSPGSPPARPARTRRSSASTSAARTRSPSARCSGSSPSGTASAPPSPSSPPPARPPNPSSAPGTFRVARPTTTFTISW